MSISRLSRFDSAADIDDAGKRQRQRRLVEHDLDGALRRLAEARWRSRRASRSSVSSWRFARASVSSLAPEMTSGTRAPAGTFISARTERTSETSRISQPISASASAFSSPRCCGQGASIKQALAALALGASFAQSSSVTKGMKGCSSCERAVEHPGGHGARLGGGCSSSPARIGLISSRYQSQNTCQMKW